jgi:perosamine synthetase
MPTSSPTLNGWHLSGIGAVNDLELNLAKWYGLPHALAVSNATSGLMGVALALDLAGSEFITTPYTWGGSLAPWLALGCRPVFADIDPYTLTLDPVSVTAHITPRTSAILAVDIGGTPCNSRALRQIADDHDLWYVADAAQSLGATRGGRPASVGADAVVVSFTTGKTLDVGEGGAIVTPHDWLYDRLIWCTQHPQRQTRDLGLGITNELAINARIHPAAAIEAAARFDHALADVKLRQERCFAILRALEALEMIEPAGAPGDDQLYPSFYRLSIALREGCAASQAAQIERTLHSGGFGGRVEPSPVRIIYQLPGFRSQNQSQACCPVAEQQITRQRVIR